MTFYIGPVILGLVFLDLAIRKFVPATKSPSARTTWIIWVLVFVAVVLLAFGMVGLLFG